MDLCSVGTEGVLKVFRQEVAQDDTKISSLGLIEIEK